MSEMHTDDALPSLLLADDDEVFCQVMGAALTRRGFEVIQAHSVEEGMARAAEVDPEYAVVDLSMPGESGLVLVQYLHEHHPGVRIVVLTGYASITTAVEAIKLGAIHYLTKPADTDEVLAALHKDEGDAGVEVGESPMSVRRLEWEHIQKVLGECDGNISQAARRLGMHRRTLQRKLQKRPVKK